MRTMTRGKAALAGSLALALGFIATPAIAADDDPQPTFELGQTEFKAGSWGDGIEFEVTLPDGLDSEDVERVVVGVGSAGPNGAGSVADGEAEEQSDGTYTATLNPDTPPVAPDEDGYPKYSATASYTYIDDDGEEEFVGADAQDLTITENVSVTGPDEATIAQLNEGVELQFAGFASNAETEGTIEYFAPGADDWQEIGDYTAPIGEDGTGVGKLTVTGGIQVEGSVRVSVTGDDTDDDSATVQHYIRIIEGDDDSGDDGDNGDDNGDDGDNATPVQPKKPSRVETGL
jgi:hypothetical protein